MRLGPGLDAHFRLSAANLQKRKAQRGAGRTEPVTVGLFECGARQHRALRVRLQQLAQRGEPAFPVGIGQGDALAHLGAAGGAVVVVALNQGQAKGLGQRQTQAGLAAARHAHDHQKQWRSVERHIGSAIQSKPKKRTSNQGTLKL
jgi:hypothetical protein